MSVRVNYNSSLTIRETLETNVPAASDAEILHNGYDTNAPLNSTSTPTATKCAVFAKALSAGAATIDLTALTGTNGVTIDGTGLEVVAAKFQNPSTNANNIQICFGASNAYLLGTNAAWKITLCPGDEYLGKFHNNPAIDATHKNIDLAGTGSQTLNVEIVLGV